MKKRIIFIVLQLFFCSFLFSQNENLNYSKFEQELKELNIEDTLFIVTEKTNFSTSTKAIFFNDLKKHRRFNKKMILPEKYHKINDSLKFKKMLQLYEKNLYLDQKKISTLQQIGTTKSYCFSKGYNRLFIDSTYIPCNIKNYNLVFHHVDISQEYIQPYFNFWEAESEKYSKLNRGPIYPLKSFGQIGSLIKNIDYFNGIYTIIELTSNYNDWDNNNLVIPINELRKILKKETVIYLEVEKLPNKYSLFERVNFQYVIND